MLQSSPKRTAALIRKFTTLRPKLAIVLGSGFHAVTAEVEGGAEIPYERLPGFPKARVAGHAGRLLAGHIGEVSVFVLCGRAHFYEGHSMAAVTFPIRVLAELGVRRVLLTNAAGGINRKFRPGDFVCLTDHINSMGVNPLRGEQRVGEPCFVDLSCVYDRALVQVMLEAAHDTKVRMHRGVYLAVSGPSYETPAEVRAFAKLGADVVGMSTVPEAIVARQCGMAVAGLSCVTNLAAGLQSKAIAHTEVLETGERVKTQARRLLRSFVELQDA